MNSTSIFALTVALLVLPSFANAQDTTVDTDVSATVNATLDLDANGEVSDDEQAAFETTLEGNIDLDANGEVSAEEQAAFDAVINATLDADADGTVSAEEQAAFDASLVVYIDTDGDGTVSAEEQAAFEAAVQANLDTNNDGEVSDEEMANAGIDEQTCEDAGLTAIIDASALVDLAMIAAATSANIVLVSDCAESDISAALAMAGSVAVREAIVANAALSSDLMARGVTEGEIIGATMQGNVLTVYATDSE